MQLAGEFAIGAFDVAPGSNSVSDREMTMKMQILAGLSGIVLACSAISGAVAQYKVTYAYGSAGYSYLDMYIAEDKGYLKDEGVDFTTSVVAGSSLAASGTIAGGFDFFDAVPASANRAIDQGQPLVHFALQMAQYGTNIVVSKEVAERLKLTSLSTEQQRVQALKGLRIAVNNPNSGPDLLLRFIAKREGWNPSTDFTLVPLVGAAAIAALEQRRIDAIAQSSPTADIVVDKLGGFLLLDLNHGGYSPLKNYPGGTLVANTNWLSKNRDAAAAVVRALWRAMDFLHNHTDEAKAVLRPRFKDVDDATFDLGFNPNVVITPSTPMLTREVMQIPLDFDHAVEANPVTVPVERTFTDEIVKLAGQQMKNK